MVRVLPDVVTLDKTFDYAVPDAWHADGRADRLAVGSIVRVDLSGRRVRGWVTEVGADPVDGMALRPLRRLSSLGPPAEMIDLAGWAAWRWAGRRVSLLRAASPRRAVHALPARRPSARRTSAPSSGGAGRSARTVGSSVGGVGRSSGGSGRSARTVGSSVGGVGRSSGGSGPLDALFERPGAVSVLRCPPSDDGARVALAAARRGDALIVVPALAAARRLADVLRRAGVRVAFGFDDWASAAAGATVVGTRTAAWLPMPRLCAAVVLNEHDEALQEEKAPTWHARDVALERARRVGAPAVLVSPTPSLEALEAGAGQTVSRSAERAGWPVAVVLDRRSDDPVLSGPFAEGFRRFLDPGEHPGRVAAVLNRKGRSRLLACKACGEMVCTADGRVPMILADDQLVARDGSERRPAVCASCGSTVLRNLRMGVTRAREELAALAGEPVGEVTASTETAPAERILIGTEALLWRLDAAGVVAFLDFDQELLAPRQRAASQALGLLARGARLLGGRRPALRSARRGSGGSGGSSGSRGASGGGVGGSSGSLGGSSGRSGGRLVIQTRQPGHPVVQAAVRADPTLVTEIERRRRRSMGLPPFAAQARVSGAGAEDFVAALPNPVAAAAAAGAVARSHPVGAVTVLGPADGRYLLRAPSHQVLLDALSRTPRGAKRLRIEVDPLRI